MFKKFYLAVVILICVFFTSCSDDKNDFDVDLIINKIYRSNWQGGSAIVKYQIENIDDKDIKGWNIYFRVSMQSGQQVVAFDGLTYSLEPGEISKPLTATGGIPDHFKKDDKPINVALRFIEVY